MSKNSIGISYAEYKRRNGVVTRKKQSHHQKPNTVVLIKQLLLAAVAIVALAMALFPITINEGSHKIKPGDAFAIVIRDIKDEIKQNHNLLIVNESVFSDRHLHNYDPMYGMRPLQPGDTISYVVRTNALMVLFRQGSIEYHLEPTK